MKGYCHVSFSIQDFEQQAVLFVHFRQVIPFILTGTACLVTQTIYNLILLQCFKCIWYAFVSITDIRNLVIECSTCFSYFHQ